MNTSLLTSPTTSPLTKLIDSKDILPFPLPGVYDTVADVPTGAVVLSDGSIYKKEGDELVGVNSYLYAGGELVLTDGGEPILVNFGYEVFTTKDEEIYTWL